MALKSRVVRGIVWSATDKWGMQLTSLVIFVMLSRLLEPKAFGLVALATVFTSFVQIFLDRGFSDAIVQREALEKAHLDTAFWLGMAFSGVLTMAGILAAELVAALFREPEIAPIVRWLSLTFLVSGMNNVQKAILKRDMAFKSLAVRSMASTLIGGVAGVIMALRGLGVWSLVGQHLVTGVAGVVVLWGVSDWRPGLSVSRTHFSQLFGFSVNVMGSKVLEFVNRRTDDFLIGIFLGTTALGYYSVAYRLLLVMIKLLTGISTAVAFPAFSKLQGDHERLRRAFYTATQYTSLIAFPAFLGLATIAPELVVLVFGAQWEPSVPVMRTLSLIGIVHSILLFNNSVIRAVGRSSWEFAIMLTNTVLNVVGFALVVRNGIVAVAAVYVVVGYALSPLSVLAVRRLIGIEIRTYLSRLVPALVASLLMMAAVSTLQYALPFAMPPRLRVALYIVGGAGVYGSAILLMAPRLGKQMRELAALALPGPRGRRPGGESAKGG